MLDEEPINATSTGRIARYVRLLQAPEMLGRPGEKKFVNADKGYIDR